MVKWPRCPFIFKGLGTKECLELVHNLFVFIYGKYGYLIILFKYFSFGYVDRKSNALDKFIEFKAESDNLLGKHI